MKDQIITVNTLPVKRLESERDEAINTLTSIVLETTSDIEVGDAIAVKIANKKNALKEALKPMRESTTKAHQDGVDLEKRTVGPMEAALKVYGQRRGEALARLTDAATLAAAIEMDNGNFDNLPTVPEVAKQGVSSKAVWSATCLDIRALIRAAIVNPSLVRFLMIDEKALNAHAKERMDDFDVPGCMIAKSYTSTTRTKTSEWRFRSGSSIKFGEPKEKLKGSEPII